MFEDWIDELGACVVAGDRRGVCDELGDLSRLRAAVDAREARLLAVIDGLDDEGAPAAAVARSVTKCSQREANSRARRADTLTELPSASDALAQGSLSVEHVDALGRAVEETSAEAVEASGLVTSAGRMAADVYARKVREWSRRQRRDADVAEQHRRRRAARRLAIFENDHGMTVVHGEFDPVTGKQITQAIVAEADRLFRLDGGRGKAEQVRSSEQRRADALFGLVSGRGRSAADGDRAPVRNQMIGLFTASDGRVANGILADGTPLSAGMVERLACGSDLFALVLSAAGDPLWTGRRTRLATDAQWRALIARDGGCGVCGADPSTCEAHHIVAWQPPGSDVSAKPELEGTRSNPQGCRVAGGPTDIYNLLLLCRHHHHLVHDSGWSLTRSADGTWILEPP